MSYHRVVNVVAGQLRVGDVVLVWPKTGVRIPERCALTEVRRDNHDGDVYLRWGAEEASQFADPWEPFQVDCLLTFGNNGGEYDGDPY